MPGVSGVVRSSGAIAFCHAEVVQRGLDGGNKPWPRRFARSAQRDRSLRGLPRLSPSGRGNTIALDRSPVETTKERLPFVQAVAG